MAETTPLTEARATSVEADTGEANRRATVILEVLAGVRGPAEAAAALEISVTHYYALERKALQGLVSACQPQPRGPTVRGPRVAQQLATLQRELDEAKRESLRQAALVRATQRAVGLPITEVSASTTAVGTAAGLSWPAELQRRSPFSRLAS